MITLAFIHEFLPSLIYAATVSLQIAAGSLFIGILLGVILAVIQTSGPLWSSWLVTLYVAIIRGTPMLIHIVFFSYVLPISFSPILIAIIAIGLNSSAYVSQIIRSGINAVGSEQTEAAYVLGFTTFQIQRYIVLPQAFRFVLPSLTNEGVTLIKDSSLASAIGVTELYKEARSIINQTYDNISVFIMVAAIYLVLTSAVSICAYFIERKIKANA